MVNIIHLNTLLVYDTLMITMLLVMILFLSSQTTGYINKFDKKK